MTWINTPAQGNSALSNAVLQDEELRKELMDIVNMTTAQGSGLGDGIATLAKTYRYTITPKEVYVQTNALGA